jgi:hypothetical protein
MVIFLLVPIRVSVSLYTRKYTILKHMLLFEHAAVEVSMQRAQLPSLPE